ncbi:MAG: type II toxin-antitoxin system YafQ family toxin [Coriobacteriales bacterium]|jgi:mRNA interferase YafQ|nr:type II toxin-antitoxin system YafQ family toxin [Coriobacteriales bacterium]
MRELKFTAAFAREIKRLKKKHYDFDELRKILALLVADKPIPKSHKDHELKGIWRGTRELHVTWKPDWLLVYRADDTVVVLEHSGSHDDLFK